jgi:hypothetical protein
VPGPCQRSRLVRHRHADVQTLVEVQTEQGPFGFVHVVRDASVRDLSAELRRVKVDPSSTRSGRALQRLAPLAGREAPGDGGRVSRRGHTMKSAWNTRSGRGTLGACVTASSHDGPEYVALVLPNARRGCMSPP